MFPVSQKPKKKTFRSETLWRYDATRTKDRSDGSNVQGIILLCKRYAAYFAMKFADFGVNSLLVLHDRNEREQKTPEHTSEKSLVRITL